LIYQKKLKIRTSIACVLFTTKPHMHNSTKNTGPKAKPSVNKNKSYNDNHAVQ